MKIMLGVLGLASLFAATSSIAGEAYVGASAGLVNIEDDSAGTGFSDTPFGFKVFGGYEFTENFALDVAYTSTLDDAEDNVGGIPIDISLDAFIIRGVGAFPVTDDFSVLGSVGFWDGDSDVSGGGLSGSGSDDGLTLGVGGKYRFESVSIRGEFEWFDTDDTIWTILLGVQINFGAN